MKGSRGHFAKLESDPEGSNIARLRYLDHYLPGKNSTKQIMVAVETFTPHCKFLVKKIQPQHLGSPVIILFR